METYEFKLIELTKNVNLSKMLLNRKIEFSDNCCLQLKGIHRYIVKNGNNKLDKPVTGEINTIKFGFVKKRNIHIVGVKIAQYEGLVYFILDDFTIGDNTLNLHVDSKYFTIGEYTSDIQFPSALYSPLIISQYLYYILDLLDSVGNMPFSDIFIDNKLKTLFEDLSTRLLCKKFVTLYHRYSEEKMRKNKLFELISYFEKIDPYEPQDVYQMVNCTITTFVVGWIDKELRHLIQDIIHDVIILISG